MRSVPKDGLIHPEYLVESAWLAARLNDPNVRVIDCTVHLRPRIDSLLSDIEPGQGDFEKAHIPGAAFLDIAHEASAQNSAMDFMLPSAEAFAEVMSRLGIADDTLVVSYSTANHWWATRLWWMLRVFGHDQAAVLNGGFGTWMREGWPVESGPARPRPSAQFTPQFRPELVAEKGQVLAAIEDGDTCIVNALRPELHSGAESTSYGRRGHITGSINVPAVFHVNSEGTFRSAAELRMLFSQVGASDKKVIAYCGGGVSATSVALMLAILGYDAVQVYDGSLSEWAADPLLPMETGG